MDYEAVRRQHKPDAIEWLFVAESPPPEEDKISTRYFYKAGVAKGDRLFYSTMWALYKDARDDEAAVEQDKEKWLRRFQADGCYLIEAVPESIPHGVKTPIRRQKIKESLPGLIERLNQLVNKDTKLILIKSNTYDIAAEPLKQAGFNVINEALLDYPGAWREWPYRQKLAELMKKHGWKDA